MKLYSKTGKKCFPPKADKHYWNITHKKLKIRVFLIFLISYVFTKAEIPCAGARKNEVAPHFVKKDRTSKVVLNKLIAILLCKLIFS